MRSHITVCLTNAVGVANPLRLPLQRLPQRVGRLVQRLPVLLLLAAVTDRFRIIKSYRNFQEASAWRQVVVVEADLVYSEG